MSTQLDSLLYFRTDLLIVRASQVEMYHFVAKFLAENAPARPLSDVKIVAGDGFFNQDMINKFGFTMAKFLLDHWHLHDSGLTQMFGKAGHELLKGHLTEMIQAESEERFNQVIKAARELLQAQKVRNGETEKAFETFVSQRESYAQYCLNATPGNRGLHGSSMSEQGHSSVLSFLNDGNKHSSYFAKPEDMISKLLKR